MRRRSLGATITPGPDGTLTITGPPTLGISSEQPAPITTSTPALNQTEQPIINININPAQVALYVGGVVLGLFLITRMFK